MNLSVISVAFVFEIPVGSAKAARPRRASKALAVVRTALLLMMVVGAASVAVAQPVELQSMCARLLELQRIAESQGRLDLSVVAETSSVGEAIDVALRVEMGPQYSVGRIEFTGHRAINDSTLRRAFALRERDLFDVGKLRRSLARLNDIGLAARVTVADIVVRRHADGATADIEIPLRTRGLRWWSLSGPVVPGLGSYQASISSRLPVWGRGALDASTYLLTFNVLSLARSLGVLTFLSKAPSAMVLLERPPLPGQEWLSGFAVSPALSVRTTVMSYGRAQLGRGLHGVLEDEPRETLAVPIVGSGRQAGEFMVCEPVQSRWRWLRRGAAHATAIALAAALP